jgi:hypothetical protein
VFRANQVRSILAPLTGVEHDTGAAIGIWTHVTKGGAARSAHRAIGSGDFVNASRSALLAGTDPNDEDSRAVFHVKANLGPLAKPLGYAIAGGTFRWTGDTDMTEAQVLGAQATTEEQTAGMDAVELIRELCDEDSWTGLDIIYAAAKAEGISHRTLRRQAADLCEKGRTGVGTSEQKTFWKLKAACNGQGLGTAITANMATTERRELAT